MRNANHRQGLEHLRAVEASERPSIVDALKDIAPDLAELAIDVVYGEIHPRPHLDARQRQIATVAALAALGSAPAQLKFHIAGALNVGCSATELVELLMQIAVYAGFPASLNGMFLAREVFADRGLLPIAPLAAAPAAETRWQAGRRMLARVDGEAGEKVIAALADVAPDLGRFIVEFGFGDIYTRPGLSLLLREIATVAALGAIGTARPQLKVHIHGLLNVGGSRPQLVETLIQLAPYAGFPAAINAMMAAKEVLDERAARTGEPA